MGSAFRFVCLALATTLLAFTTCSHAAQPVLQRGYDAAVTGAKLDEVTLTPSKVTPATFGLVFKLPVDDNVYAQPLYVPNVAVPGHGTRNVVYIATMSDTLYAFDADTGGAPLWSANFASRVGATPVQMAKIAFSGNRNIVGNLGILSTPVIDASSKMLYLVACTLENNTMAYRLHAVDIRNGSEPYGAGTLISGSYGGSTFDARYQTQRVSLTLAGKQVVMAFGAVELEYAGGYVGWVMAYDKRTLQQSGRFATVTTGSRGGGVWQSGRPPAVDGAGNVYVYVGNAYSQGYDGVNNFAESVIKLDPANGLQLVDWFTPKNWSQMDVADQDLTSSGPLYIPSKGLIVGGGKTGDLYLLNSANLGKFNASDSQIVQKLRVAPSEIRGGPVFWQRSTANGGSRLYNWAVSDWVKAYKFSGTTLAATPVTQGSGTFYYPGGIMTLSANGEQPGSGVLWATTAAGSGAADNPPVPGVLRAYDAEDVSVELWNSTLNKTRDDFGNLAKFVPPLVTNGRVYVATSSRQVAVYGLLTGFTVSPASVAFGNQLINTASAAATITVTNPGSSALPLTGITLSTSGSQPYSQTNTCASALAAGASCTISVVFNPATAGAAAATLSIKAGNGAGTKTVALSGTGTVGSYTLSASTLAFGDQLINTSSSPSGITVTNTGAAALPINGITLSGGVSRPFAQTNTCGGSLTTGASCTISVTFTPTAAGNASATLSIDAGNGAGTRNVALNGKGIVVSFKVTPASVDFGDQQVGSSSAPVSIKVANTGTEALMFSGIALSTSGSQPFSQSNTCTSPMAAGTTCTVKVVFNPAAAGAVSGTLSIDAGSLAGTQTVSLNGNGIVLSYSVAPAAVDFGTQRIGSVSATTSITLTNTGTVALPVTDISLSTSGSQPYSQTNTCADPIAVGASCRIDVVFDPNAPGATPATLRFHAGTQSSAINLSGTGTFETTLSASAERVTAGTPVTLTWTSIAGAVCTATGGSSDDNWTGTLADSGSHTVTESAAANRTYGLDCVANDVTASASVAVAVTVPSVTLSASPATVTLGKPVSLSWSSTDAESCMAGDGQSGDGWTGSQATSGSASVTPVAAGNVSYTLTCSASSQSVSATQRVTVNSPPASSGGGGGALDSLSLLSLLALMMLRQRQQRPS